MKHTLKWFLNRRGKFIYRKPIKTQSGKRCCDMCENGKVKVLRDKKIGKITVSTAQYIFDCQNELGIRYFDKPV